MAFSRSAMLRMFPFLALFLLAVSLNAEGDSAGAMRGVVSDPTGAVVPGATVRLTNRINGFERTVTTDATGQFSIPNVPFHFYRIDVTAPGFSPLTKSVVFSAPEMNLNLVLQVAAASQTVTVESSGDLVEDDPTFHTGLDHDQFMKVPLESQSSTLSSLVTLSSPGVSADSNGMFHGMGDHASNSFSVDGESITDQQSKVFSNQLPSNAIQSIEVIGGAPPAEYGDKTSLVIVATTRSGMGVTKPTGSVYSSYGSFGSADGGANVSYGGKNWGNFIEADGLDTGRFLDSPEFAVFHDKGNEQNFFDRADYSFSQADSIHVDLNYSRSWFQTPNTYDNLNVQNVIAGGNGATPVFGNVGNAGQGSKINTFNLSPTYTRIISNFAVLNIGAFIRKDFYDYFPSSNPLADLGPANLQTSSIGQYRTLTDSAIHADYTFAKGIHDIKAGVQYGQTFLREHDQLGIVENTYNSPCVDAVTGVSLPGFSNPSQCDGVTSIANKNYLSVLAPYDLTRGGSEYLYFGQADVKELALYIEDQIKAGNWNFNLGVRGDVYNGLTRASQAEPRLGVAYNVKPTSTVLGVSYARTLETPFNENLVLSSEGCANSVLAPLLNCSPGVNSTMAPGYRNEFHATLQQAFGQHLVVSGEYIWKYTHNAFDFSVLGNTPITFPIDWHNSKIPGYALHVEVPTWRGFSAYSVMSSVAARFFPPQVAGAGATVGQSGYPFRIDHDEKFNQTTHLQYTISRSGWLNGLWGGFNWRYDSGQVAGSTPCYDSTDPNTACANSSVLLNGQPAVAMVDNNIPATTNPVTGANVYLPFTADEEFEAGMACNGVKATPNQALPAVCPANEFTSNLLKVPAIGKGSNDHNPPRVAPRSLFDLSLGKSNIFHADRYKTDLELTAINLTNKYALYNFLSTFSGTHYVTPRALTAMVTVNF
ncbi:MAG: carboxypeptidase regulatory-like domain-containing protein [Terracidiphilus sp.]